MFPYIPLKGPPGKPGSLGSPGFPIGFPKQKKKGKHTEKTTDKQKQQLKNA